MIKITFLGAGSTIFAKNVLGDCMLTDCLRDSHIALYDIDEERLEESYLLINTLNKSINEGRAKVTKHLGVTNRKEALEDADFVVNAIQIGGYQPCTVIDFEIPKKYGLYQTIGDTLGIGGIMRALRTIPVLKEIAEDMEEVCPQAWFLNYTNPMAMLTGYMQRYTNIKTIGLCHSVQVCSKCLLEFLDIKVDGYKDFIAGINHMGWLLKIEDLEGRDLYPLIRQRVSEKSREGKNHDMVRFEYIKYFGYYCTESSEHNAEYTPFFIKTKYPELIENYNIPLDEYPRRCEEQIENWKKQRDKIFLNGKITHVRSREYASRIMEAMVTDQPYRIAGNVINHGAIANLPENACVEIPCMVDGMGVHPVYVGNLPEQLASLNRTNINPQLLTIEAAVSKKKSDIYRAAMLDPHTAAELSLNDIVKMCDELILEHQKAGYMHEYH